ncbi:hypothetical protein UVI_02035040 [Ustilaginoidea virens]|uniref:DNA replication regulator Sld3 C-terminal domain-containing protein n=1 Tax=Ustilaginoidea virens TaxID=1159556 RepID=A0A1B5KSR8_USTVR|nr:hypothetical protein UVI_02035040 [Ustilaginoidea virens]
MDAAAMDHLLKPSIAIKVRRIRIPPPRGPPLGPAEPPVDAKSRSPEIKQPHPPDLHVQPRVLLPLMLLPRQHLPLSSLDFSSPEPGFPRTRLVESRIKILDLESRLGCTPNVLIAKNDAKGTLYALEREANGLYVVCRLGPWVDLGQLVMNASAASYDRLARRHLAPCTLEPAGPTVTPQMHKEQKKKRAAIEAIQSLVRKKSKPQSVSQANEGGDSSCQPGVVAQGGSQQLPSAETNSEEVAATEYPSDMPQLPLDISIEPTAPISSPQNAEAILDHIRAQYFEALYRSMGSLAYFAKGPLSRARSAFRLDLESNLEMDDLVDFLKSLILTTVQIDKKYRESIPDIINKMKSFVDTSDDGAKKRRKSKMMKLGRNSLYPLEDESIRNWWKAARPELSDEDVSISSSQIKSHVSVLRTRETQLQMILILEILALESLKSADDPGGSSLPLSAGEGSQLQEASKTPAPRRRNKHNLPLLVDVHADRLTIWQSTASDEQLMMGDSQATQASSHNHTQPKSSPEPLKDFCVDIIVPFFSARLPELCNAINLKLGGPVIVSPIKSQSSRASSSRRERKPGAATKRSGQPNARRTLQRALSTEQFHRRSVSRGPSNAIALMRSATSTSVSGVKREGSEPLCLKDLPKGEVLMCRAKQSPLSRVHNTNVLQGMKANRKALVEAELKDAISALRKPNREVIGRAMAEADERRASTSLSAKKKAGAKKPSRIAIPASVQVKATPANNRFKDALAIKPEPSADMSADGTDELVPHSSVGHVVPSTGHRHGRRDALAESASPAGHCAGRTPAGLPAQPSFIKRAETYQEPARLPLSPLHGKRRTVADEASNAGDAGDASHASVDSSPPMPRSREIPGTPTRRSSLSRLDLAHSPAPGHEQAHSRQVSIYEKLGWDDDFDDT